MIFGRTRLFVHCELASETERIGPSRWAIVYGDTT